MILFLINLFIFLPFKVNMIKKEFNLYMYDMCLEFLFEGFIFMGFLINNFIK